MRANRVKAAIVRYREAEKKRCAQLGLCANGERILGGFTVNLSAHLTSVTLNYINFSNWLYICTSPFHHR